MVRILSVLKLMKQDGRLREERDWEPSSWRVEYADEEQCGTAEVMGVDGMRFKAWADGWG